VLKLQPVANAEGAGVRTFAHIAKKPVGAGAVVKLVDEFEIWKLPEPQGKLGSEKAQKRRVAVIVDFPLALCRPGDNAEARGEARGDGDIADDKAMVADPYTSPQFSGGVIIFAETDRRAAHPTKHEAGADIVEIASVDGAQHIVVGVLRIPEADDVSERPLREDAAKNIDV
jgi:hypothetical protein